MRGIFPYTPSKLKTEIYSFLYSEQFVSFGKRAGEKRFDKEAENLMKTTEWGRNCPFSNSTEPGCIESGSISDSSKIDA